jgi:hypothetical protein
MNIYPYGHDFGNSETSAVMLGPNWHTERRIPSVTAPGSWKKVMESAAGAGKTVKDLLAHNHYVLEYDIHTSEGVRHIEKVVGQKVFDDGATPLETRGDSSRYWTNHYNAEMLMVGSASMVRDEEYGLHVVTGQPIANYSQENASYVCQALQGLHRFWLNGEQRVMHVLSVKCIMEGAGALIAYGSDEKETLQGVVDIGGQTTDLFLAKGQRPLSNLCKGKPLGVAAAAERFNQQFREAHGRSLNLEACKDLLHQHVNRAGYRQVRDRNGNLIPTTELFSLIESALREIGQEIATFLAASWDEYLLDITRILIVGGGAHYYARDIQERFSNATPSYKPEMANAAGYVSLAEVIASRARVQAVQHKSA